MSVDSQCSSPKRPKRKAPPSLRNATLCRVPLAYCQGVLACAPLHLDRSKGFILLFTTAERGSASPSLLFGLCLLQVACPFGADSIGSSPPGWRRGAGSCEPPAANQEEAFLGLVAGRNNGGQNERC